jgi:hypothetical protein
MTIVGHRWIRDPPSGADLQRVLHGVRPGRGRLEQEALLRRFGADVERERQVEEALHLVVVAIADAVGR